MNRRAFLKGSGAVTVAVAGGSVWRAVDQGIILRGRGPAYEPWEDWRGVDDDGPLALLRAAILASNPHNTQPWLFRVADSRIDLHADLARGLGAFDPYLREMHIGLGCALENMVLAARPNGYAPVATLFAGCLSSGSDHSGACVEERSEHGPSPVAPELDRIRVARLELAAANRRPEPLYDLIPHRHTNRGAYDAERPLPDEALAALAAAGNAEPAVRLLLFAGRERTELGRLIVEATESIIADATMVRDSDRWFRHTRDEVQEHRDGPTLDAAGLPPLTTALAKFLPRPSPEQNHRFWLEATRDVHVPSAPLLGILAVRDLYDRPQNLRAGRVWQRMHLEATRHGIAMQPLNQPVELVDRQREQRVVPAMATALESLVDGSEWRPTFVFRAGYPLRTAKSSPRRPVEDVLAPA